MSVIATFSVDGRDFVIGDAFASATDVDVDAEPIVPISVDIAPYFWLDGAPEAVQLDSLRDDSRVEAVTVVDSFEDRHMVRVDWGVQSDEFVDAIVDAGAVVLEAHRTGDVWTVQLRFDDYDSLSGFNRRCLENGIDLELEQVHNPARPEGGPKAELTPEQHEVLLAAIEEGYFEVPREITLVELGEQLGISDSAVSQRLRRGLETLLSTVLSDIGAESR